MCCDPTAQDILTLTVLTTGHKSAKQQKTGHSSTVGGCSSTIDQSRPVHKGVQCDKCGVTPIIGLRYKSQVACHDWYQGRITSRHVNVFGIQGCAGHA